MLACTLSALGLPLNFGSVHQRRMNAQPHDPFHCSRSKDLLRPFTQAYERTSGCFQERLAALLLQSEDTSAHNALHLKTDASAFQPPNSTHNQMQDLALFTSIRIQKANEKSNPKTSPWWNRHPGLPRMRQSRRLLVSRGSPPLHHTLWHLRCKSISHNPRFQNLLRWRHWPGPL
jgi:hypothetical protein